MRGEPGRGAFSLGRDEDAEELMRRVRDAILAEVPRGEQRIRYYIVAVVLGGRYALHFRVEEAHRALPGADARRAARIGGRAAAVGQGLARAEARRPAAERPHRSHRPRDRRAVWHC